MGAKTAMIAAGMSGVVVVLSLASCFVSAHLLHFRGPLGIFHHRDLHIYYAWMHDGDEMRSLQHVVSEYCSVVKEVMYGGKVCDGLNAAFPLGMCLLAAVAMNALFVQSAAAFLLWDYATRKPARSTRKTATGLLIAGLIVLVLGLFAYIMLVTLPLDSDDSPVRMAFINESAASGFGYCLFILILVAVIQGVQLVVVATGTSSDEQYVEEIKADKECQRDYGSYTQAAGSTGYGGADVGGGALQVTDITIRPVEPSTQWGASAW
mmetsp:Transcript_114851/g.331891  ORF Transcript_114851/g.331891 Transcript_114851/m.331891 type:complete len:265 (-) Transcript_114851:46-840(-)|eukprot:CAMPEP_0176108252 /NCGR_PEP_ID=MMETSP0120_2-20121206/54341_1 /TAXON_ID=160619 /ORGANISM="Kryptoperidinium foliaceum, Strain CCMP 1326" /LENGTH=264 /DNA_ID=CAMNT_0017442415 /DNA_START=110 /DNA_END=904 /DNA_ORIENTATION=-